MSDEAEFEQKFVEFYEGLGGAYILDDDGNPQHEPDVFKWCEWMVRAQKERLLVVADDRDEGGAYNWEVSTVFLPQQAFCTRPFFFETMIFGGPLNLYRRQYVTREEALLGHQAACGLVRKAMTRGKVPEGGA